MSTSTPPKIDRAAFYGAIRVPLFHGKFNQGQVDGIEAVLDRWEDPAKPRYSDDLRHLAYIFPTGYHETGATMQPIEEWGKGKGKPYGRPSKNTGHRYYGRGLVQLTWERNYIKLGERLGIPLVRHPELALVMVHAVDILFVGMFEGLFTGKKLTDYISGDRCDFWNARRIINGTDRAGDIAAYAKHFHSALTGAIHG